MSTFLRVNAYFIMLITLLGARFKKIRLLIMYLYRIRLYNFTVNRKILSKMQTNFKQIANILKTNIIFIM